ncbi:unnamed protein product [Leptidea sinapis]|uniref:Protein CNPPD1 n=1 Tax=Leptidea sinapis TaxID=189913 RepID=A0A5E4QJY3_9NEOP|nr:unnamed protein product [Leptidea sinapis]
MSNISKRKKEGSRTKIKSMGDHKEFLKRITKTLYYGQLPTLPCLSLPVTEISCEVWSGAQRGRSVRRLHADAAARIAHSACVSPCALVLAVLYLERLQRCNPEYLANTAPADLFLVSLMVSNKFLQDDGEDDEVICSEWAVSGGLELQQLKRMELEFLKAIEWNVFVSEKSFDYGLCWLERQVALRQAQQRGFFTYSDLAASSHGRLLADTLGSVSGACVALALSYLTSFLTVVTSTLLISHAWLPMLHYMAARGTHLTTLDTELTTNIHQGVLVNNSTIDLLTDILAEQTVTDSITCCQKWQKYQDQMETKKNWNDGVVVNDWKLFETWWSKTSVLNWLYQSSLINPMQRWLEKINEYMDLVRSSLMDEDKSYMEQCHVDGRRNCIRQRLNLSKLSFFTTSVSDR